MALSMATEFIENPAGEPETSYPFHQLRPRQLAWRALPLRRPKAPATRHPCTHPTSSPLFLRGWISDSPLTSIHLVA